MEKKLVFVENNRPVTDSLTVAEVFGKRHDLVLRDIRDLGCSREFSLLNFEESTYMNERGRQYPKIILTEQGFVLLVMGYTGKDAMHFKEAYIAEFERMREELRQSRMTNQSQLPQSYLEALKALVVQVEKNDQLEADRLMLQQCLSEAQPKLTYIDRILESKDTVCITQIAKDCGISGRRLNGILHKMSSTKSKGNGFCTGSTKTWVIPSPIPSNTHVQTVKMGRKSKPSGHRKVDCSFMAS